MFLRYTKLYLILAIIALIGFGSCQDKDISMDETGENDMIFEGGPSLELMVTLDMMGGTSVLEDNPLVAEENYVDPQKVRVLFFDSNDKFLFESKSRWVRQLSSTSNEASQWKVAVPLFSYGNDADYNWDFSAIKNKLTSGTFKIAIMANHSDREWNMGISGKTITTDQLVGGGWYENDGPRWRNENTICHAEKTGDYTQLKDVFDIHHCQYDPIYDGKNWDNADKTATKDDGTTWYRNYQFYDFISEDMKLNGSTVPMMGPSTSWVDWGNNDEAAMKGPVINGVNWEYRRAMIPKQSHPIPMYGIQQFNAIDPDKWAPDEMFSLSRTGDKPISLLRSIVKLELLIPDAYDIDAITLFYANIYSRCEPMDVWTPTEQIWAEDANEEEWQRIYDYGVLTEKKGISDVTESKTKYQQNLAWFYGRWLEKGWWFRKGSKADAEKLVNTRGKSTIYPKIFNTCIQRNTAIYANTDVSVFHDIAGYHHVILYIGEKNINDPSKLMDIGSRAAGDPTVMYWQIGLTPKNNNPYKTGYIYSFPVTEFTSANKAKASAQPTTYNNNNPAKFENPSSGLAKKQNDTDTNIADFYYLQRVQQEDSNTPLPYPLIRNHVYRITLTNTSYPNSWRKARGNGVDEAPEFDMRFESFRSRSIDFSHLMYRGGSAPTLQTVKDDGLVRK